MSTVLLAFISLALFAFIIFCHEFGHFIVAKLLGVNVLEFAIGMGPALWQGRRDEKSTIYSIRAFPIGGFCKMQGEDLEDEEEDEEDFEEEEEEEAPGRRPLREEMLPPEDLDPSGSFMAQPFFNKILILLAGPFMNFVLAFVVCAVMLNLFVTAETLSFHPQ